MRNGWRWHAHWKPWQKGPRHQSRSPFSPMHRQRSRGWHTMSQNQGRNMHWRRESTSPRYDKQSQPSPLRSGGARRTKGWK